MADDYFPRPGVHFRAGQNSFITYINGDLADLGSRPARWGPRAGAGWRGRLAREAATRRRLRPLPVGCHRRHKVVKKRGRE